MQRLPVPDGALGMDWTFTTGWIVLAAAILVSAWLVGLTLRFARKTEFLVEAMVQHAFLPEKRRRYMTLLSLEGSFFLLSALAWGLGQAGVIPPAASNLAVPAFLLAGMASIATLTWVGLRPASLSATDRAELRAAGPAFLYSLAVAPIAERPDEGPTGSR